MLARRSRSPTPWTLASLRGELAELSEGTPAGATSVAAALIAEAQAAGEAVAWIAGRGSIFYPPDLAARGVDLDGIIVVWAPGAGRSLLAADQLVRSEAFGLVIIDLGAGARVDEAQLARLTRLAARGGTAVLFLTVKQREEHSLGSMITLRGAVLDGPPGAPLIVTVRDKHGATGASTRRLFDAPPGMR